MPFDGIIGLAPSKSNFIEGLYRAGAIGRKQVGISLRPGERKMWLGGSTTEGKITWLPNTDHDGYWATNPVRFFYTEVATKKRVYLPGKWDHGGRTTLLLGRNVTAPVGS